MWRLLRDRRVPTFTKIIPALAVVYLVSPYDLVGDRIPLLGQFDDLIVVTVLLMLFVVACPGEVVADLTIGRKLRDMQDQQTGQQPGSKKKTVDAEIRYLDEDEDEPGDTAKNDEDRPEQ